MKGIRSYEEFLFDKYRNNDISLRGGGRRLELRDLSI